MMKTNLDKNNVAEITREIKERVSLPYKPIGLSLIRNKEEIPKGARRPSKRNTTWPLCLAENMVRTFGWTIALMLEDHFCIFAAAGVGNIELPKYLKKGIMGFYHTKTTELGVKLQDFVESCFHESESTLGIMLTPATEPLFMPEWLAFYGNPSQIGKLAKAIAWYRGEPVQVLAGGFGDCILSTWTALLNKKPRIIIPSAGEKILGHSEENDVFLSMPVQEMRDLLEGMKATDHILPYPTAKYLMFEAQAPEGYPIHLISHKTYREWKKAKE
jgi:uncharacterized protein (DUF169 family)